MQEEVKGEESPKDESQVVQFPNKISGDLHYEIEFSDKGYQIKFDRGINPELSANMIAREGIKYAKQNLISSLSQAKGKDLNIVKDRLSKVTTCEYVLGMVIEQMIGEILIDKELSAESGSKEMAEILPQQAEIADLSNDNSEKVD